MTSNPPSGSEPPIPAAFRDPLEDWPNDNLLIGDEERMDFSKRRPSFQIAWPGNYRLDGPAFVYTDRQSRRVSTIIGYPTQLLAAAERR